MVPVGAQNRPRPGLAGWILGFGLLVVTACTATTVVTTTSLSPAPAPPAPTTTTTLDPALAEPLPLDPDVIKGTLDNGLTYYIRFNDSPGGRAELRLAVDAGSLLEDEDQAGAAHFLEHMMFNGTERFPRNDLIAVLESFGPRFGADINAFTSFDETVYELSLPAQDSRLLDLGVNVLREWAGRATLTETDVVEERGVILEEWRLRDQGLSGRLSQLVQDLLLSRTPYEGHAPIGDAEAIRSTTPETLRRFYRDWYRPELMAVVAVGDFDVGEMEDRIVSAFGDLEGAGQPRERAANDWAPSGEAHAATLADTEATFASIEVLWPSSSGSGATVGTLREALVHQVAMEMLATRLSDDALRGLVPVLSAEASSFRMARAIELSGVALEARPAELADALAALLTELARVRAHGFTQGEFERVVDRLLALAKQDLEDEGTTQDREYADAIVVHHLSGASLMSAAQRYEIERALLEGLSRDEVEETFVAFLDEATPYVLAFGPDDADPPIPSPEAIVAMIDELATVSVGPREEPPALETLMMPPAAVFVVDRRDDDRFGYVTLTYGNGATVLLWPTDIADNLVTADIASFGGTSLLTLEDLPEAELIPEIVVRSGIGPADAATLQAFLADRLVEVSPYISETREGMFGGAATEDVEVMLQIIHLLMTSPRMDPVAVEAVLAETLTLDASREDVPDLAIGDQLIDAYYSGDPRYFTVPTAAQLADFDADRALEIFRQRFADAGDFAFAFVGDFDLDEMIDLTSRYIGTLPGDGVGERYVDNQPLPPRRIQLRVVEAGTDPQGLVAMFFTNQLDPTARDRLTGRLLELIVNARLRDRIRERLSATYSPFAAIDLQREPDPFVEATIRVTGDPGRLDEIAAEVLDDLADLRVNGPTEAEFSTALQQLRTELDLINNLELARALVASILYPDQPVIELVERYTLLEEITPGDVLRLAHITYADNQRIEIRLVPRG